MEEGKIVEYIEGGKFVCGLCLQKKDSKLHVLTLSNREANIPAKRAVLISGPVFSTDASREVLLGKLRRVEETRNNLKLHVDVKELWDLVREELQSYSNNYLAQLVFGEDITDDHVSALIRALFEDRLHFKMKEGRFVPNTEEKVEQILRQREEEALKEEMLKTGGEWLKEVQKGKVVEPPPYKDRIIDMLVHLAVYGDDAPSLKEGKELLSKIGISDIYKARELLIKMGIWEEDQNIELIKFRIPTAFTDEQLETAQSLASQDIDFTGREDLRHLPTITIDGAETKDFDDALTLEIKKDVIDLGIHIADVASRIPPGSPIDQAAQERASSLYLPRRHIPMLPPELSQDALSLKESCDRPAISLLAKLDFNGKLLEYRFTPSVVQVKRQMTYDEVDGIFPEESDFRLLHKISLDMRKQRFDCGALSLSLPEVHIRVHFDSSISIHLIDQNTPSRIIVAESMILYNSLLARYCRDNGIPFLYRTQGEPAQILSMEDPGGYLYYVFQQRRKLSPLMIDTRPKPHCSLGLDVYSHVTSPIRRYLDIVGQRQFTASLTGSEPVYDEKGLEDIRLSVAPALKDLAVVRRKRERYWILKYLKENKGAKYTALILDELKRRYRIVLPDFQLVEEIKRQDGLLLQPGRRILVEIKKADPWEDRLDLEYAGDS